MRANLRLADLESAGGRARCKLMNVKVPESTMARIDAVAAALGCSKTDAVIALLNEGLDHSGDVLKGFTRPTIAASPPKRVCTEPGCGRAYVAKGLCANHYQAARRTVTA